MSSDRGKTLVDIARSYERVVDQENLDPRTVEDLRIGVGVIGEFLDESASLQMMGHWEPDCDIGFLEKTLAAYLPLVVGVDTAIYRTAFPKAGEAWRKLHVLAQSLNKKQPVRFLEPTISYSPDEDFTPPQLQFRLGIEDEAGRDWLKEVRAKAWDVLFSTQVGFRATVLVVRITGDA